MIYTMWKRVAAVFILQRDRRNDLLIAKIRNSPSVTIANGVLSIGGLTLAEHREVLLWPRVTRVAMETADRRARETESERWRTLVDLASAKTAGVLETDGHYSVRTHLLPSDLEAWQARQSQSHLDAVLRPLWQQQEVAEEEGRRRQAELDRAEAARTKTGDDDDDGGPDTGQSQSPKQKRHDTSREMGDD